VQRWPRFHDAQAICCIASLPVVVDEYDGGINVTTNERQLGAIKGPQNEDLFGNGLPIVWAGAR